MTYIHPKRYKGTNKHTPNKKNITEHSENIRRNQVEEYCLKCDKFMGREHDFEECTKSTCPFPGLPVSLLNPEYKCKVEGESE